MPVPDAPDPYAVVADGIKAVIEDEFAAEQFHPLHDRLHESLGLQRVAIGISPEREGRWNRARNVAEHYILIQFYDLWTDEIDNETMVDPRKITGYARRLKQALRSAQVSAGTPEVWFYDVESIDYPNDPTGNKTRFHMLIRAYGDNQNLVETR